MIRFSCIVLQLFAVANTYVPKTLTSPKTVIKIINFLLRNKKKFVLCVYSPLKALSGDGHFFSKIWQLQCAVNLSLYSELLELNVSKLTEF